MLVMPFLQDLEISENCNYLAVRMANIPIRPVKQNENTLDLCFSVLKTWKVVYPYSLMQLLYLNDLDCDIVLPSN